MAEEDGSTEEERKRYDNVCFAFANATTTRLFRGNVDADADFSPPCERSKEKQKNGTRDYNSDANYRHTSYQYYSTHRISK